MKVFKKISFAVIALVPILAVMVFALTNIGNTNGVNFVPLGDLAISDGADGVRFACTADSWGDRIIMPIVGENPVNGLLGALGRFCIWLESSAGIPTSVPLFMACLYAVFAFFVEVLGYVIDLLLFVPRKCLEVFK